MLSLYEKNLAPPYQLKNIRDTTENFSEKPLVGEKKFSEVHKADTYRYKHMLLIF